MHGNLPTWRDKITAAGRHPTITEIIMASADHYGVRWIDILEDVRAVQIVRARDAAAYLSRELTQRSFPVISSTLNKHHTTVMDACRKVDRLLAAGNVKLRGDLDKIAAAAIDLAQTRPPPKKTPLELTALQREVDQLSARLIELINKYELVA